MRKFVAEAAVAVLVLVEDVFAVVEVLVDRTVVTVVVDAVVEAGLDEVVLDVEVAEAVAVPGTHWSREGLQKVSNACCAWKVGHLA